YGSAPLSSPVTTNSISDGLSSTILLGPRAAAFGGSNALAYWSPASVISTAISPGHLNQYVRMGFISGASGDAYAHSGHHPGVTIVAMCDGSVKSVDEKISMQVFNAMGSKAGVVAGFAEEARVDN
ncbi:MAG: DUF1559 domain-containing protein, partial [Planctomycetia bacterium]